MSNWQGPQGYMALEPLQFNVSIELILSIYRSIWPCLMKNNQIS